MSRKDVKVQSSKLDGERYSSQSGFTVIEVMVSMAIFSAAILGLAASATTVMRANQTSYSYTIATNLAQDKLEELKANPATLASGGPDYPTALGMTFTRTWTVSPPTVTLNASQIDVQVSWTDYTSRSITISSAVN
jgi:type IV pilus modification protein PilV